MDFALRLVNDVLVSIWEIFSWTWWFWLFLILRFLAVDTWLFWRREWYKKYDLKRIIMEIRIPREINKSPRAMEQVLASIHSLRNVAGNLREKWWDGEVVRWFTLEMTSLGGEVHFYITMYHKYRNLVEAAFYSYYPDVELEEVEDYIVRFPESVQETYKQGYDLWGTEMVLAKEPYYPIKTYEDFESPDEDKQYDPISAFLEVLGQVQPEQMVGIQIHITPLSSDEWRGAYEDKIKELKESAQKGGKGGGKKANMHVSFEGGILPIFEVRGTEEKKSDFDALKSLSRSPGETETLRAVEDNLAKPAFKTLIRFIYFSPVSLFYDSFARRGLAGAFNQYGTQDMNMFVQNFAVSTKVDLWTWSIPRFFPAIRREYRKQRLLYEYRKRKKPLSNFIGKLITSHFFNWNFASMEFKMNTKCLATLFHPPTTMVLTAPHIRRMESRKAGPPAGLPIYGEADELEKFQ
ncbi:MAG: hypothetical protein V1856_03150 [Candidatus Liptonbacteria bacterium]